MLIPSYRTWQTRTFLVASLAGVLYFAWEGAPCHATRKGEMYYLFMCVSVMTVALVLRSHHEAWAAQAEEGNWFFAPGDQRPFAKNVAEDHTSQMAHRIAVELDGHLRGLVVRRDRGILSPTVFPMMVFPLLFVQQETLVYFGVAQVMNFPAKIGAPLVGLCWALLEIPRLCRRVANMAKVQELLSNLLEHGDAALVCEVYRRVNMASLLQATDYEVHELLVEKALDQGMLNALAKAVLLNGMQKYGISRRRLDYVLDLIQSCKAAELTELKGFLDSTGDYNSLYKLVYVDIKDSSARDQVLSHIHTQSCIARRQAGRAVGIKVLSDIDDTLLCSGGKFPAGCDDRIPQHMVYPGCAALFKALDRDWSPDVASCNLVFLSARPHLYKDLAENKSFHKFKELYSTGQLHCVPSLLPGSLALGLFAVAKAFFIQAHGWRDVGERKAECYWKFKALYEEYDFVLFGDNGQGDLLTGQLIRQQESEEMESGCDESSSCCSSSQDSPEPEDERCARDCWPWPFWKPSCLQRPWKRPVCPWAGSQLRAVMIHQVIPLEESMGLEKDRQRPENWRQELADSGIYIFSCYPDAALKLHDISQDLISARQLRKVAEDAIEKFDHARVLYPEWANDWSPIERSLRQSIRRIGFVVASEDDMDFERDSRSSGSSSDGDEETGLGAQRGFRSTPGPFPDSSRCSADLGFLLSVALSSLAFLGGNPGQGRSGDSSDAWKQDPNDEKWKGRKFEWFFTESDEDIKLSSLPRPGFLPPEFWEAFYEKGVFIAVFQAATLIGGFILIFQFAPYAINQVLYALTGTGPPPSP
ncbi:unnamed protein product [Symbiodinium sp. CCMP2592]|nr:unnamed protein product [Symbiodinium sp. CCMP2592]